MIKKIISISLTLIIVFTMCSMAIVCANAQTLPEKPDGTYRYFFCLPDKWLNDSTIFTGNTAGIYWWNGTDAQNYYPGVAAYKADFDGVYYYDVPTDVEVLIWNNFFDGGSFVGAPNYSADIRTRNVLTDGYAPGENDRYPEGIDNFDGMIYVVDYNQFDYNNYSGKTTFGGEWFYYYGNGEYGVSPVRGDSEIHTEQALNMKSDTPDDTRPTESEITFILGDVNKDATVNIKDATEIQKSIVGTVTLDETAKYSADVDLNEKINIKDATAIQKFLVFLELDLPIGQTMNK